MHHSQSRRLQRQCVPQLLVRRRPLQRRSTPFELEFTDRGARHVSRRWVAAWALPASHLFPPLRLGYPTRRCCPRRLTAVYLRAATRSATPPCRPWCRHYPSFLLLVPLAYHSRMTNSSTSMATPCILRSGCLLTAWTASSLLQASLRRCLRLASLPLGLARCRICRRIRSRRRIYRCPNERRIRIHKHSLCRPGSRHLTPMISRAPVKVETRRHQLRVRSPHLPRPSPAHQSRRCSSARSSAHRWSRSLCVRLPRRLRSLVQQRQPSRRCKASLSTARARSSITRSGRLAYRLPCRHSQSSPLLVGSPAAQKDSVAGERRQWPLTLRTTSTRVRTGARLRRTRLRSGRRRRGPRNPTKRGSVCETRRACFFSLTIVTL